MRPIASALTGAERALGGDLPLSQSNARRRFETYAFQLRTAGLLRFALAPRRFSGGEPNTGRRTRIRPRRFSTIRWRR
jgi:hypothetical protein